MGFTTPPYRRIVVEPDWTWFEEQPDAEPEPEREPAPVEEPELVPA